MRSKETTTKRPVVVPPAPIAPKLAIPPAPIAPSCKQKTAAKRKRDEPETNVSRTKAQEAPVKKQKCELQSATPVEHFTRILGDQKSLDDFRPFARSAECFIEPTVVRSFVSLIFSDYLCAALSTNGKQSSKHKTSRRRGLKSRTNRTFSFFRRVPMLRICST
jgi:hypothetical protein